MAIYVSKSQLLVIAWIHSPPPPTCSLPTTSRHNFILLRRCESLGFHNHAYVFQDSQFQKLTYLGDKFPDNWVNVSAKRIWLVIRSYCFSLKQIPSVEIFFLSIDHLCIFVCLSSYIHKHHHTFQFWIKNNICI